MAWGDLAVESQTLSPLPPNLRSGLTAITVLAFISFFSSAILFFYLFYKLATWHFFLKNRRESEVQQTGSFQKAVDFTLGIDGIFTESDNNNKTDGQAPQLDATVQHAPKHPNQFLVLIVNLLLADMHQGVAFFLNVEWLRRDAVVAGTASCFTQGLFVSLGDLSSSMFITAIAIHTYLSVVNRRRVQQKVLYLFIASIWVFVYAISFLPIAGTRGGAEYGGFFVRAGSWCWMNREYENLRLLTHYLWIFIALAMTSLLYIGIFLSIRRQARSGRSTTPDDDGDSTQLQLSRNPAFLIYPVIYVLCTLPLAVGRIATMAGADVPLGYFCFAGAMISSNGFFDCLLFGTTRNVILFASKYEVDDADLGLKTFTFMKTPTNRRFGNVISIQGGRQRGEENEAVGGWWTWHHRGGGSDPRGRRGMTRTTSQESLRGPAIHMDTVTSVVVEVDDTKDRDPRFPNPSLSASPSVNSTEKGFPSVISRAS
ncbi:hypothetical protein G7Z17_g2854 [Cylindrodendrum hubeiense]|uniref:G-protein coupled receptors family 1 profile domain-containing protein n=1 Tax=Cylindrodendrum hubeiense TaxID=595255 RepID=A0A9P5HDI4_9HYPO|nr:hypothetical protein G7Z17_g2854 [Cylindrodendrum hubeiense]